MYHLISFAAFQFLNVVNVSKNLNLIGHSDYVAHLGKHVDFFDKVIEVLPTQSPLVFICDGAKWIWKWIEEYYPNSTQILDLYHCKEHLYAFAKNKGSCLVQVQ